MNGVSPLAITPISADIVPQLARIHLDVFPGAESTALGYRYALALVDWFRRYDGAVALAAMAGGVPAGYVLGVRSIDLHRLYRSLLPVVLGCVLARPWITADGELRRMALWRGRLLLGVTRPRTPPSPSVMVLKTIAVATSWQFRGVGGALLAAFTSAARKCEARTLMLSVLRSNAAAQAFYQHRGWRPTGGTDGKFVDYIAELA
jgi:ribosomal protein S18 acetylase RimI-like enzyme